MITGTERRMWVTFFFRWLGTMVMLLLTSLFSSWEERGVTIMPGEKKGRSSCWRSMRGGARMYWELRMLGRRNLCSFFTSHFS